MSAATTSSAPPLPAYVQFTPEQLQLATGTPLGSGAISQVVQSRLRHRDDLPIVVKILSKLQLLQQRKVEAVMSEKAALLTLGPHPYIARLYGTAQSEDELYFVMECLPHGDLLQHIRRTASRRVQEYSTSVAGNGSHNRRGEAATEGNGQTGKAVLTSEAADSCPTLASSPATAPSLTPIPTTSRALRCLDFNDIRVITAQLILALARTYEKGVVLRDLKPENVVFDGKYRACLIDFDTVDLAGAACLPESNHGVALRSGDGDATPPSLPSPPAKRLSVSDIQRMRKKTASFCGTAQYVSPEMVGECKWSFSSDLWALGTMVYEMLYGVHMFSGLGPFEVLQKVVKGVAAADHPIPFPPVALGEGDDDGGFAAVKDFILKLVSIDPSQRLGVHPTTRGLDLDRLKQHAMFDGFDWSVLEAQIATFQPRIFATREQDELAHAAPTRPDATAASADADPDPSPSLVSLYHIVPFNEPAYADYVYKATADANPFERFMQHIILDDADPGNNDAAKKGNADDASTEAQKQQSTAVTHDAPAPAASPSPSSEPPMATPSPPADESDDIMDVIDDVGMRYDGMAADPDFHQ